VNWKAVAASGQTVSKPLVVAPISRCCSVRVSAAAVRFHQSDRGHDLHRRPARCKLGRRQRRRSYARGVFVGVSTQCHHFLCPKPPCLSPPLQQAYHFGHPSIDPIAQANYFISAVNAGELTPRVGRRLSALAAVARPLHLVQSAATRLAPARSSSSSTSRTTTAWRLGTSGRGCRRSWARSRR